MQQVTVWEVSWKSSRMLFTTRELAIASIRLSHSNLPNFKLIETDLGSVIAEYDNKNGEPAMEWFTLTQILDREWVYDQPEHL